MYQKKTFSTRAICRALGLNERMLIHWAEKGLVRPLVEADGYPSRRQYTRANLVEIGVIKALWGKVSKRTILAALMWLSHYQKTPELTEFLVIGEDRVTPVRYKDLAGETPSMQHRIFFDQIRADDLVIILNIQKIRNEIDLIFE